MIKYIALVLLIILSNLVAFPATASVCRNYEGQQICILSINRSAKNYWEYRAIVSIDQVKRPIEVYNCRERVRVRQDGKIVPFAHNGAGKLICSFLQKS
ncbi:hypothetical protein IQ243_07375 [Nostocales cyanobacterium LEGE 11386]|nr:hypothetical protein [Nostocales cyanobacterium LEGE 11386]